MNLELQRMTRKILGIFIKDIYPSCKFTKIGSQKCSLLFQDFVLPELNQNCLLFVL